MPTRKPLALSEKDYDQLRNQFAVALAQSWFTTHPNLPSDRVREARVVWELADAFMQTRAPAPGA